MKALSSLIFLKEGRSGKIKERVCINGALQRAYNPKDDATAPTMANEWLFITSAIAAPKKRYVRCIGVPGAFLDTESEKDVLMVLDGELAEMMVCIAPQMWEPM